MLTVVLAACAGCTDGEPRPDSAAVPASGPEVLAHRWDQQSGPRAVTDPVAVAGRFAAYTVNDGHLFLTVFNPRSGQVESGVPTSSASVTPGVDLDVVHDGPRVLFFERYEFARDWLTDNLAVRGDEVAGDRSFFDYGMTSLLGLKLSAQLGTWLGKPLEDVLVWNYGTLDSLVTYAAGAAGAGAAPQPVQAAIAEDEVARLLAAELGMTEGAKSE